MEGGTDEGGKEGGRQGGWVRDGGSEGGTGKVGRMREGENY